MKRAFLLAICLGSCAPAPAFAQHHPSLVSLDQGEPAPFAGRLVIESEWLRIVQEMDAYDATLPMLEADLERCQSERKTIGNDGADALDDGAAEVRGVAETIAAVPVPLVEAPEPVSRVAWAGAAAVASVVGGVLVYAGLEQVGGRWQDVGSFGGVLVGGGAVVGLCWILE